MTEGETEKLDLNKGMWFTYEAFPKQYLHVTGAISKVLSKLEGMAWVLTQQERIHSADSPVDSVLC